MVSIIIPTLNEEKVLGKCLQTVKNYAPETEIIVVDNFSTDKTSVIARNYTKLVFSHGPERSAQRNFGAKKATGTHLLFLDADMRLTKNVLSEALSLVQKGKFIIALPELAVGTTFWEKSIALERNLYYQEKLLAAARLYPRYIFNKLGGFNEELFAGEDWDLSSRAEKKGYQLVFTHNPVIHSERVTSLKDFLRIKYYYIQNISRYAAIRPQQFATQSSFKNRISIYIHHWPKLLADPFHFAGFVFLKALIWYYWHIKKNNLNDTKHL